MREIPKDELTFEYMRSRGPGGQNVNRTNSAVQLRWRPLESAAFTERERERVHKYFFGKLTVDGELLIRSDRLRDQGGNRQDCLDKLQEMLVRALHVPKKRIATKPTRSAKEKRIKQKKIQGEKKSWRKQNYHD